MWFGDNCNLDSHIRILDFTRSRDISNSSDSPTRLIYIDEKVPRMLGGQIFASNNRIYVVGGHYTADNLLALDGSLIDYPNPNTTKSLDTHVWAFDLVKEKWESPWDNGLGDQTPDYANVAFDDRGKIGWMFGGVTRANEGWQATANTANLARFDVSPRSGFFPEGESVAYNISTRLTPSAPERIAGGSMVYFRDIGGEGILVVIGGGHAGFEDTVHVSLHLIPGSVPKVLIHMPHSYQWNPSWYMTSRIIHGTYKRLQHLPVLGFPPGVL